MITAHNPGPPAARAATAPRRPAVLPRRQLVALLITVLGNYAAQIPYAADLYGAHFSVRGGVLLGSTLAWFLIGITGCLRGWRGGYWALLSFLLAEFAFYFHGEILHMLSGYGLAYQIAHAPDAVVRAVFIVGDINLVAAGYFAGWLAWRHHRLTRDDRDSGDRPPSG